MGAYRRLLNLSRPFFPKLGLALLLSTLGAALNAGSMYLVKLVTDDVLTPKQAVTELDQFSLFMLNLTGSDMGADVTKLIAGLLVIYPMMIVGIMLLKGGFNYGSEVLRNLAANGIVLEVRQRLFDKYTSLPLAYHSRQRIGELTSRVTNDAAIVHSGVTDAVGRIGAAGMNIIALGGLIFFINAEFAVHVLVYFPLAMAPLILIGRKLRKYSYSYQERMADMNALLHETLAGIRVVFSFGMEKAEGQRFGAAAKAYFDAVMKQIRIQALGGPIMDLIGGIGIGVMIWMAGSRVVAGTLTMGDFLAIMGAISSIYPQVKHLNGVNVAINNSIAAASRVFDVLDTPEVIADKEGAKIAAPISQAIRFEDVSFSYGEDKTILEGINLEAAVGKRVAIVGPSGSGKTTLVDLVPRFHDPASGKITIDGVDLRDVTIGSLRGQIGLVTQETFLFNDTIANNIGYGKPGADRKEIEAAAKAANAHEFILEQAEGYDTEIGERGVRLSGGQRQRLSIARAILKNPPLLILDEATSALDTESERLVQDALDTLMSKRTTLVIAHRLSTVQSADEIVVLKEGKVEERGKHTDLLANNGLYARLYKMQFREVEAA